MAAYPEPNEVDETAEFAQTLGREIAAAQSFVALLEREQQMLVKGQVDDLLDLVRQKNGLAAELATLAAQRQRLLAASGLLNDRQGMAAWFAAHPGETRMHSAWSALLAVAGQARELNRVNGELIQERMQSNAQALEALLGSNAATNLYGPDGQSGLPSGQRISDSA
ncbi:MAG: flagella synthesis chaperone protein FlgN [Candidatus Accumulibacter appositus]|uniref:Flagella synthesis chaperone protein FlgN n=1 Tax=Candidatus Accumulibacter appositus TaxID=1454003 RepID=A0A011P1I2_9PROT|nr:flagellar protein FlgN [Accumulibacter sp.]EXI81456.1 MAG: flagella synthesis chaperone protein FlgN [Candidatus Accumulibacter appositus]HRF03307.1 flagellar protein FlgN [Accumulibacter sp.]